MHQFGHTELASFVYGIILDKDLLAKPAESTGRKIVITEVARPGTRSCVASVLL
jgi:hypothetical protein